MSRSVQRMITYSKVVDRREQSNFVVVVALFDTIDVPIHLKPYAALGKLSKCCS